MSSAEIRPLLMRSNRLLGANLVEANLVTIEQLENANEKLLELLAEGSPRQTSLLSLLCYEMKALPEENALRHVVEEHNLGLIDLLNYEGSEDIRKGLDLPSCWATWTVPFDREEDFVLIATAYYLSPAVRTFWERQFPGPVLWYGTTMEQIADHLDRIQTEQASASTSLPTSS